MVLSVLGFAITSFWKVPLGVVGMIRASAWCGGADGGTAGLCPAGDLVAYVAIKKHRVTKGDLFTLLALLGLRDISTACMALLEPGELLCAQSSAAAGIVPR